MTTKIIDILRADPWAITPEGFARILAIAERRNDVSPEALEAYRADHVPTAERLQMRDGVAILSVEGPLFRHANLFTSISGATSYDVMRRDFQAALDDPEVKAILLSFDTPGGHVNGVNEMAKAIRDARGVKPIVAYVGGMAASAGYWMASQADQIVIDETAILGSIGVRAAFPAQGDDGSTEFISSQSPGKRLDLATDEGRARVQSRVDALADVFVEAVASGRGVSPKDVETKFGAGDVLVGKAAVAAGMADEIGTFESVLSQLAGNTSPIRNGTDKASHVPPQRIGAIHVNAHSAPPVDAADDLWRIMTTQGADAAGYVAGQRAASPWQASAPIHPNHATGARMKRDTTISISADGTIEGIRAETVAAAQPGQVSDATIDALWARAIAEQSFGAATIAAPDPATSPATPASADNAGDLWANAIANINASKSEGTI